MQVGTQWLGLSGALSSTPFFLPSNFWEGVTVIGLDRETTYAVSVQGVGVDGNFTAFGPVTMFSTPPGRSEVSST